MAGSRVIIQPRDRRLREHLEVVGVIDREQATQLAPFGSVARANARLLQLTRAGYLRRTFTGTINGGRKAVYRLPGGRRARGRDQLEHELSVSDLYCAFRSHPAFVGWRRLTEPLAPTQVIPDGLALVRSGSGVLPMLIEVDRGTETLGVIDRKVSSYVALALSGEAERVLGYPRFRVLLVTTSERRLRNIAVRIARRTRRLFFLSTQEMIKTQGAWSPVWIRPGGDSRLPLTLCDTAGAVEGFPPAAPASAAGAANHLTKNSAPDSMRIRAEV